MKKMFAFVFALIFLLALPVNAEKIKFKDQNYDFKNYSNIQLTGITSMEIDRTEFEVDESASDKVRMALMSAFSKKHRNVIDGSTAQITSQMTPKLGCNVKIYVFGNDKIWHEAWVETIHTTETIYIDDYDRDKKRRTKAISIPVTQKVNHPAGYYYTARVDLEFTVKDLRTDKVVYTIRDTRSRGGETDTGGMLKRICSDFVDDVAK